MKISAVVACCILKANLHWGWAKSCQAQSFVSFIAYRSYCAEPCMA